ncbi:hypothetical protein [Bradyrhizobium sp. C9]|uniref:hypothetical protein n=1 Tax=Bradyrhizobium sp. C9 TaxID=142585 RepID=UPI000BEAE805|nr:hypothetical protein [Bradyrhizobium sp. C9]PDT78301.1 hypothetical protein CO675_06160 [Bradyrhizobium sp. C9]
MGDITMRRVILDARGHESIVICVDGNSACERAGSRVRSDQAPLAPRMMRRAAPLSFAAVALMCRSGAPGSGGGAQAQSNGIAGNSLHLAQAKTNLAGDTGPAAEQPQSAEALARELATARKDIELLQGLLTKERENSVHVENALQSEAEKLKKSLKGMPQGDVADLRRSVPKERDDPLALGNVWNVRRCDQGARSRCEG